MSIPRPLFEAVTTLTKDHRIYRSLVRTGQRVELLLDAAGLRRRVSPPPLYKRDLLTAYARALGPRIFVETGTYLGDTAFDLAEVVEHVYTIELDPELAARARERFSDIANVTVLQGDSGELLRELVPLLGEPVLFWLDAHYSGHVTAQGGAESPIADELAAVLSHWTDDSAVLIDDADCFVGRAGYLSRRTLRGLVRERAPKLDMVVERNVIRLVPPGLRVETLERPERSARTLGKSAPT